MLEKRRECDGAHDVDWHRLLAMKFVDALDVAEYHTFSTGEPGGFLQIFVVLDDIHVALDERSDAPIESSLTNGVPRRSTLDL